MKKLMMIAFALMAVGCQPLNKEQNLLMAVGYASISEQKGRSVEEQQVRAMRASKVDAYRELAEQVYGLRVSARSDIEDTRLGRELTTGSVDGVIRGAQVVRSYAVGDNYVTELSLDMNTMDRFKDYGDVQQVPIKKQTTLF